MKINMSCLNFRGGRNGGRRKGVDEGGAMNGGKDVNGDAVNGDVVKCRASVESDVMAALDRLRAVEPRASDMEITAFVNKLLSVCAEAYKHLSCITQAYAAAGGAAREARDAIEMAREGEGRWRERYRRLDGRREELEREVGRLKRLIKFNDLEDDGGAYPDVVE